MTNETKTRTERQRLLWGLANLISNNLRFRGYKHRFNRRPDIPMELVAEAGPTQWVDWPQIFRDVTIRTIIPWPHREGRRVLELRFVCGHSINIDSLNYSYQDARCHLCEIESFCHFQKLLMDAQRKPEPEVLITQALATPEGKAALAEVMTRLVS